MHPRLLEYTKLLSQIPKPVGSLKFSKKGKLVICLIEFRIQKEIEWVMNAVLRVYSPEEIGIAMIYGTTNAEYVEETFKNWENMLLIKTEHKNLNRGTYSAFLKQPQIYDNFSNFSHILIYQTDALLYRKIPDSYFKYDYIGSPWKLDNQCAKYPAGNGGFSLRNIKKVQDACSMFKNVKFPKIHRGNEDIFFCSQSNFEYPKFNSKFHKAFAIERVFYPTPVGSHQIWLTQMTVQNWKDFVKENIVEGLYKGNIKEHIVNEEDEDEDDKIKRIMDKSFEVEKEIILKTKTELKELLKVEQNVGPFLVEFVDLRQNKWEIVSSVKYDILFCKNEDPKSAVVVHNIGRQHCAVVHKKGPGCFHFIRDEYIYLGFKGFPEGGRSYADIQAPVGNSFSHAKGLPPNGIIYLKAKFGEEAPGAKRNDYSLSEYSDKNITVPELVFVLFTGVGYYNQLFSLETAVYLANISKRALRLFIQHPLVHCGQPNKCYGILIDYISKKFERHLQYGFSVHPYKPIPNCKRIDLKTKLSNIVFIDNEFVDQKYAKSRNAFVHSRSDVDPSILDDLYNLEIKQIKIDKSNASRCFTNFYTTKERYLLMSQIANDLSEQIEPIEKIYKEIVKSLGPRKNILAIHLRFGDVHKSLSAISGSNNSIEKNIGELVRKYSKVLIMTDRRDNPFFKKYKNKFIFTEDLIKGNHRNILTKYFKTTSVAEFIIQKKICEYAEEFIGSQGSTVSVHIQYRNYINGKDYEKYTHMSCGHYNSKILSLENKSKGEYTWVKKNYLRGHPMAWSMFFEDNIHRFLFYNVDTWLDVSDISITNNRVKFNHSQFNGGILFIKTDLLFGYLDELMKIKKRFVLITASNDDHCAQYMECPNNDKTILTRINNFLNKEELISWYCKNACIVHKKVIPLPLGPKMQWYTTQFHGEDINTHNRLFNRYFTNPKERFYEGISKKNELYFNFNNTTSKPFFKIHKDIRPKSMTELSNNGFKRDESLDFEQYIEKLSEYKFSASPPGRGIDTHRAWESLLVGTIPIIISSPIDAVFDDLPVILVKDYKEITIPYLNNKYKELISRKDYNFDKLYKNYWVDKIRASYNE